MAKSCPVCKIVKSSNEIFNVKSDTKMSTSVIILQLGPQYTGNKFQGIRSPNELEETIP